VELVREKNGKVIPLKEGSSFDDAGSVAAKRSHDDDDSDDDSVKRSMARRRKSEKPGDVMHVCRDCKKEFKRPCDLTKHEKTHSRPWKCTEEKCKYYELGWPTEKERDRHVNDKHSSAPPQYKCLYPPCTYASKRESNCKQHMEKAHGWEYVRSKSNGRKKAGSSDRSPPTPLTPFMGTPRSSLATPMTPFLPSPSVPLMNDYEFQGYGYPPAPMFQVQDDYRRDSVTTDGSVLTYSSGHSPIEQTAFDDAVSPEEPMIDHNQVMNCNFNTNFNTTTFQQPITPAMSNPAYDHTFEGLDFTSFQVPNPPAALHLSPGAQPDVTLVPPQMPNDEGFGDEMANFGPPTGDFTLFDTNSNPVPGVNPTQNFFPELSHYGAQFDMYDSSMQFDEMMGGFENQH
jgi:uncharacterized C2H2 Zn-finger protein